MKQCLFVIVGIITVVVLMAAGGQIGGNPLAGVGGAVTSVFGRTGVVTAVVGDYSAFFPTSVYCGITGTCANTASSGAKIVRGVSPALPGVASPTFNQTTITLSAASSFSDTTYECTFESHNNTPNGTTNATALYLNKVTGTQFIIIALPLASTDPIGYVCTGN